MSLDIQALFRKAEESLAAARGLLRDGYFDFAASRAYYAMFYIAEALLAHKGLTYSKHSAVIAGFGQEYARTGRLAPKFHRWLIDAQEFRNIGDYGIEAHVSEDEAGAVCEWASEFIQGAKALLDKEGDDNKP
jgi:uncharacterized protein (UPF0332 family)